MTSILYFEFQLLHSSSVIAAILSYFKVLKLYLKSVSLQPVNFHIALNSGKSVTLNCTKNTYKRFLLEISHGDEYKRIMYCYESPTPRLAQRGFQSGIATPI